MSTSQTLDRGLAVLESIAWATAPPTIDELADEYGVHRSITYRIVRTLEARHLVRRDASGRCHAGVRLASLARGVRAPLLTAAVPVLTGLANELGMTSFLVVRDGDDAVTIESIEPQTSEIHLAYRPGIRHPVVLGAPGLALLAGGPPIDGERAEVAVARRRGWAVSAGEVIAGLASVAAPIADGSGSAAGAVAVVHLAAADVDTDAVGRRVAAAACSIAEMTDRPADDPETIVDVTSPASSYHRAPGEVPPPPAGCPVHHTWSPLDDDYLRDPYSIAARLRDDTPVFYAEELGYLVITRMEDIDAVFRNPDVYASANVQDPVFPLSDGATRGARGARLRPDRGDVEPARARPRPDPGVHPPGLLAAPAEVARAVRAPSQPRADRRDARQRAAGRVHRRPRVPAAR